MELHSYRRRCPAPQPISGTMNRLIAALGLTREYGGWTAVEQWPELVGDTVARAAKAVSFEDGCLIVAVPDAAWRQELTMRLEELLTEIRRTPYGHSVTSIRLVRAQKG